MPINFYQKKRSNQLNQSSIRTMSKRLFILVIFLLFVRPELRVCESSTLRIIPQAVVEAITPAQAHNIRVVEVITPTQAHNIRVDALIARYEIFDASLTKIDYLLSLSQDQR